MIRGSNGEAGTLDSPLTLLLQGTVIRQSNGLWVAATPLFPTTDSFNEH